MSRIAVREDREPTALPPLSEAVDPEALTTLLESPAAVTVVLEQEGYGVQIGPGPLEGR